MLGTQKTPTRNIRSRGKVFRDPVHRLIRVQPGHEYILDLIDTPEFQRLRRIRQLGVSWMTYPGAEHSRFSHSLGVFNFAQRIHSSLLSRYKDHSGLRDYLNLHQRELFSAALLHDIGHGPFSHMIERAFRDTADHEAKTIELISSNESQVSQVLDAYKINKKAVAEIIQKTSNDRLIVDIVSSQLDADRMDYLLRDSLFTGVEYGRYDSEWIIRNLCVGLDRSGDQVGGDEDFSRHRLCLDVDRGLYSAEQLILARTHMTMQVYMHRVTRGFEVHLLTMFKMAAQFADQGILPKETPEIVFNFLKNKGRLGYSQWIRFDEMTMYSAIHIWAEAEQENITPLRRLSSAFLDRRQIFKCRVFDPGQIGTNVKLWAKLGGVGQQERDWDIDEGKCQQYKGLFYESKKEERGSMSDSILLASGEPGDSACRAESESDLFKSLDADTQTIHRIYYDKEKYAAFEKILDEFNLTDER
jgi:hypothetical protein